MNIPNEEIERVVVEVPEGHVHIRTTLVLRDGTEFTLQEAAMANMVRAFLTVKTHPRRNRVELRSCQLAERKQGYAPWQLLEVDDEEI